MTRAVIRHNRVVLTVAALLASVPVVADLVLSRALAPFRYFTSDTFYYLIVARNAAQHGVFAFDGEHPTNGFHPLWQIVVALLYKICSAAGLGEVAFCYLVVLVGVALTAGAVWLLGLSMARAGGALPARFILLPVGLHALILSPVWLYTQNVLGKTNHAEGPLPLYGTTWSYANGMESSLALFAYALLGFVWTKAPRPAAMGALLLGLLGALLVLARLDHALIAGCALGLLGWRWFLAEGQQSLPRIASMAVGLIAPVAAYLLINVGYCGMAFPVSGAAKTQFPHLVFENAKNLLLLVQENAGAQFWLDRCFRLAQLVLPAGTAGILLLVVVRRYRSRRPPQPGDDAPDAFADFVAATGVGVLLLCTLVFWFFDTFAYGSWSLPVPVLFVSLAFLTLGPRGRVRGLLRTAALPAAAGCALFLTLGYQPGYHAKYRRFYERRQDVVASFGATTPKIIELDDGIVGFATRFQTMSGLGLAADKELFQAIRGGRMASLARDRGYDHIASLVYLDPTREGAFASLIGSYGHEPDALVQPQFSLAYYDPETGFAAVRVTHGTTQRQAP